VTHEDLQTYKQWADEGRSFDGREAFRLYDTFGLPRDFIEDVCRDAGFSVNWTVFEAAMHEQRTKARASWKGGAKESANPAYAKIADTFKTEKDFYRDTKSKDARIEAIITKGGAVNELKAGESGEVVLDRTVVYANPAGRFPTPVRSTIIPNRSSSRQSPERFIPSRD